MVMSSVLLSSLVSHDSPLSRALPERLLPGAIWRADQLAPTATRTWNTGFGALDAVLPGGGWPERSLTEILPTSEGSAWRLLQPALERRLALPDARLVLIGCPQVPHALFPRTLSAMARIVWIRAQTDAERLWATEQVLRARSLCTFVVTWLPRARPPQIRRLQVQAQGGNGLAFVLRPPAAERDPSAAPLRLGLCAREDWQLVVQVLKRKGPPLETPVALQAIPPALDGWATPQSCSSSKSAPTFHSPRATSPVLAFVLPQGPAEQRHAGNAHKAGETTNRPLFERQPRPSA